MGKVRVLTERKGCYRWAAVILAAAWPLACVPKVAAQGPLAAAETPSDDHSKFLLHALKAMREGRLYDAVEAYRRAYAGADTDAERAAALLGEGDAWAALEQYGQAAEAYAQAARLRGAADHQRLRAWLGAAKSAAAAGNTKLVVEASEWLASSGDATEADRAAALARLAEMRFEEGDLSGAEALWRRLTDEFSSYPAARTARQRLADIFLARGDMEALRKLLAAARGAGQPDAEGLHVYAATRLASAGKVRPALDICEALLAWRPSSEAGWAQAWHLHDQLGDSDVFLRAALERARSDSQVAQGLAGVAENLAASPRPEQRTRSLVLYELLLALAPDSPRLLYGATRVALEAGRMDLAERWSAALARTEPNNTSAQALRGRVLAALNRLDEALTALKKAAHYSPADADSARYLMAMLEDAGLAEEAPKVAAEVRTATGNPTALAGDLAQLYQRVGRWREAAVELAKAIAGGEASGGYVTSLVYQWLADPAGAQETAAAMAELAAKGELPRVMLPAYFCLLALSGRQQDVAAQLATLPAEQRGEAAVQTAQLLVLAGRDDLASQLYEVALGGQLPPETELQVTLRLAEDLSTAGLVAEARQLLEAHRKPGMPSRLAAAYDLALAELLLAAGAVGEAEALLSGMASQVSGTDAVRLRLLLGESAFRRGDYSAVRRLLEPLIGDRQAAAQGAAEAPPAPPGLGELDVPAQVAVPMTPAGGTPADAAARAAFLLAEVALRENELSEARKGYLALVSSAPATVAATRAVGRLGLLSALAELDDAECARFLAGLKLLDAGDPDQARSLWADWLDRPSGPMAAYGWFLLAEALEAREPLRAAEEFERLATGLPDAPLAPIALYRAAMLRARTQPALAVALAGRLQQHYPDSALAPVAAQLAEELSARL